MKAIADAVRISVTLASLSLGDNDLGDEGVEALSLGLKDSKSLATLKLSNVYSISTKFGPRGVATLASIIAVMPSLVVCNVSNSADVKSARLLHSVILRRNNNNS